MEDHDLAMAIGNCLSPIRDLSILESRMLEIFQRRENHNLSDSIVLCVYEDNEILWPLIIIYLVTFIWFVVVKDITTV